jgi:hypothetical protein
VIAVVAPPVLAVIGTVRKSVRRIVRTMTNLSVRIGDIGVNGGYAELAEPRDVLVNDRWR